MQIGKTQKTLWIQNWVDTKLSLFAKKRKLKDSTCARIQEINKNVVLPATELNMLHFWVYKPVRSSENRFSSENKFAWSGITCNKTGHVSYEEAKKVVTKLDHKLDLSELKWTQDTPGVAFWNFLCIFPFYWMKIQLKSWIQDWVFNSV